MINNQRYLWSNRCLNQLEQKCSPNYLGILPSERKPFSPDTSINSEPSSICEVCTGCPTCMPVVLSAQLHPYCQQLLEWRAHSQDGSCLLLEEATRNATFPNLKCQADSKQFSNSHLSPKKPLKFGVGSSGNTYPGTYSLNLKTKQQILAYGHTIIAKWSINIQGAWALFPSFLIWRGLYCFYWDLIPSNEINWQNSANPEEALPDNSW